MVCSELTVMMNMTKKCLALLPHVSSAPPWGSLTTWTRRVTCITFTSRCAILAVINCACMTSSIERSNDATGDPLDSKSFCSFVFTFNLFKCLCFIECNVIIGWKVTTRKRSASWRDWNQQREATLPRRRVVRESISDCKSFRTIWKRSGCYGNISKRRQHALPRNLNKWVAWGIFNIIFAGSLYFDVLT